jgi:hypothetical protein
MVEECKSEIIERYGSIEAVDVKSLLESIHVIYALMDDELSRIPADLIPKIENCLLENLFSKLEQLGRAHGSHP